jgi:hypothetical protein
VPGSCALLDFLLGHAAVWRRIVLRCLRRTAVLRRCRPADQPGRHRLWALTEFPRGCAQVIPRVLAVFRC